VPFSCKWIIKVTKRYDTSEKLGFAISGKANGAKMLNVNRARPINNLMLPDQTKNAKFFEENTARKNK
jgi:hypothetical protein